MSDNLYQASLTQEDYKEIKTYQISRLVYVAFFGGVVPTIVLGTKNAHWLRIDKKIIALMIILGAVILLFKPIFLGLIAASYVGRNNLNMIKWIYRGACMLLYLGYYYFLREKFNQHVVTGGEVRPLLKDAIIWSAVGIIIEVILMLAGGAIGSYAL